MQQTGAEIVLKYVVAIIAVCAALDALAQESTNLRSIVSGPEIEASVVETALDPIEAALQAMSLEQKIAQLMFVTFESGHTPSSGERRILKGYTPGGILLPSVMSPPSFEKYVQELRANPVEAQHKVPILIATNFYSLSARRHVGNPYAPLPSLLALGASRDADAMRSAAALIADYLNVFGVPLHFGPTLSLSPSIDGAEIGYNQFGEDPAFASMGARTFGAVFKEKGIHWMPLGFPGGDANRTGSSPPVLVTPAATMGELDLLPYKEAIAAGARFIHVSNVLVPTLEPEPVPASVSYAVMTRLLREELAFDGIVVAGPMDDPDLTRYYDGPNAPVRALMAGADMVWWSTSGPRAEQFVGQLAVAVEQREVPESLIDERVRHVMKVKSELGLLEKPLPHSRDIDKLVKELDKNALSIELEESGIVFAKLSPAMFPITVERSVPIGLTGVAGVEELYAALLEQKIEPIARHKIGTAQHGKQVFGFEIDRVLRRAEGTRTLICMLSADIHGPTQRELLRRFKQIGTRIVTVMFGVPDDIEKYLENSDALIIMLRPAEGNLGPAMVALANVMLGRGPVRILEPTRELTVQVGEAVRLDINGIAITPAARLPITASESLPAGLGFGFLAPTEKRKITWDFGDGMKASGPQTQHAYAAPGTYALKVDMIESGASIASGEFSIVVIPGN